MASDWRELALAASSGVGGVLLSQVFALVRERRRNLDNHAGIHAAIEARIIDRFDDLAAEVRGEHRAMNRRTDALAEELAGNTAVLNLLAGRLDQGEHPATINRRRRRPNDFEEDR